MQAAQRETQRGFSLIEVLVSLGLLAGVMVAISSLFIFGGKEVKSGRQMTEAYSIAHDILEEIDRMTYTQAWSFFVPSSVNPAVDTSYTVSTASTTGMSTAAAAAINAYKAAIDSKFNQGVATLEFEALDAAGAAAKLDSTVAGGGMALRVTVRVEWYEGVNQRYVHLRSVRF